MKGIHRTIRTDRLLLREIDHGDLKNVYIGLSHPEVVRHYGISFDSLEATRAQMEWFADPKQIWWAICSPDNQTFCGAGGLNDLSDKHKKAEIGLWLLPQFWGRGIMAEALPLICDYGFGQVGLHRIEAFVESENENCKRAMSKLDFSFEGSMKDCEMKNGKFISIDIYAKINTA